MPKDTLSYLKARRIELSKYFRYHLNEKIPNNKIYYSALGSHNSSVYFNCLNSLRA